MRISKNFLGKSLIFSILFYSLFCELKSQILDKHFWQIYLSLYDIKFFELLQKIQLDSNFFKTIEFPSVYISIESFCSIFNLYSNYNENL